MTLSVDGSGPYNYAITNQATRQRQSDLHDPARPSAQQTPSPHKTSTEFGQTPTAIADVEKAARYIDAVRELKATSIHPKQAFASKTFLDVAYFESDIRLVDTYA